MSVETHRFTVGTFQCIAINDGVLTMGPSSIFFEGATPDELEAALQQYHLKPEHLKIPCTCLLVDTGSHRVLIDCGSGQTNDHPELGNLLAGLEQEAIDVNSITHVLLTHGHFDHIGGCTDKDGNLTYPNARYVMARGERDYWMQVDMGMPYETLKLLSSKDRLDLIEPDAEVVPGVRALATPGHTYHHTSVEITSGTETLVCCIDTMDHPLQAEHPTWGANWDVDRSQSIASRRRVLELATEKNALFHGFHFPFPGLGRVRQNGDVWAWESV